MTTLLIKDLAHAADLDAQAMTAVRGGYSCCAPGYGLPQSYGAPYSAPYSPPYAAPYGKPSNMSFDASQVLNQSQNVINNNGNNAAFVNGISSTVSPTQTGSNNINL